MQKTHGSCVLLYIYRPQSVLFDVYTRTVHSEPIGALLPAIDIIFYTWDSYVPFCCFSLHSGSNLLVPGLCLVCFRKCGRSHELKPKQRDYLQPWAEAFATVSVELSVHTGTFDPSLCSTAREV
jgi:hypothetical protein